MLSMSTAFEEVHGGQTLGEKKLEEKRMLKFAVVNMLMIGNSWFKKRFKHLVTYQSEDCKTLIDYILNERSLKKVVSNVEVIVGEEYAAKVVVDFKVSTHFHPKRRFAPRTKVWKLKDLANQMEVSNVFKTLIPGKKTSEKTNEH